MPSVAGSRTTTCRKFDESCVNRPVRIIVSRLSFWVSSTARHFRSASRCLQMSRIQPSGPRPTDGHLKELVTHVHHKAVVAPADVPARPWRDSRAAAARIDGAGLDGNGQDGG